MRLLSSTFPENCLSYKTPIHFNNLDIGGFYFFPCYKITLPFSITAHTRTYHLLQNAHVVFNNCMQRNTLQLATKCQVGFNKTCIHVVLQNATVFLWWPNMIDMRSFQNEIHKFNLPKSWTLLNMDSMSLLATKTEGFRRGTRPSIL